MPSTANVSSLALSGVGTSGELSLPEKTSVYLEKVDCHLLAGQNDLAAQVMEEARMDLRVSLSHLFQSSVTKKLVEIYHRSSENSCVNILTQVGAKCQGTGEEIRLDVASADLSLNRGDTQQAISALRAVPPENQYYMQARHKMADIYLNHLHDKRMFATVYRFVTLYV